MASTNAHRPKSMATGYVDNLFSRPSSRFAYHVHRQGGRLPTTDLMAVDDLAEGVHRTHVGQTGERIGYGFIANLFDKHRDHGETV